MSWAIANSDEKAWRRECQMASEDNTIFSNFRRLNHVCYITENRHGDHQIKEIWENIKILSPRIAIKLKIISSRDRLGNPLESDTAEIEGYRISGSTAYVVLLIAQMEKAFGPLKGMNVAEIGGGYGNMAHLLFLLGEIKSYTGFDLKEPSNLQKKFLYHQGWEGSFPGLGENKLPSYDLCFSSYSLSELNKECANEYGESVLSKSARGFHCWNWIFNSIPFPDSQSVVEWMTSVVGKPVSGTSNPDHTTTFVWGQS